MKLPLASLNVTNAEFNEWRLEGFTLRTPKAIGLKKWRKIEMVLRGLWRLVK